MKKDTQDLKKMKANLPKKELLKVYKKIKTFSIRSDNIHPPYDLVILGDFGWLLDFTSLYQYITK